MLLFSIVFADELVFSTIGSDQFFVPKKRIFAAALERAISSIVFIDINETVAFLHLTGGCADEINAAPWGITHQLDSVFERSAHGDYMLAHVFDAVAIMDAAIRFNLINRAQAIFNDHERDLVTVVQLIEKEPKTHGIDRPAPFGRFEIGVWHTKQHIAGLFEELRVGGDAAR